MAEAKIISGTSIAAELRSKIAQEIATAKLHPQSGGQVPGLAVVLIGDETGDAEYLASKEYKQYLDARKYVANKGKMAKEIGMNSFDFRMPSSTTQAELLKKIDELNKDRSVHGILVQLPLPRHISSEAVINAIDPAKDVDGFHPINSGKLLNGQPDAIVSCTPKGALMMIKSHLGNNLDGKNAVVLGRSNIVGKPMAVLLLQSNCNVTVVHSKTKHDDMVAALKNADIVVAAVGKEKMVKGAWIKPGATVIDVGINSTPNGLFGDVDFDEVKKVAGAITPVPGGAGPMTIACLLDNTLEAFCRSKGIERGNSQGRVRG